MKIRPFLKQTAILFAFFMLPITLTAQQDIPIHDASKASVSQAQPTATPSAPSLSAKGYVLMDADTGKILAQKDMDQTMEPASLTKMMTLYLTFQALQEGQIHLEDEVTVSKKAWEMKGSLMFIKVGSKVSVEELIEGVIVASGNDASVALAEYVAGTEETFAELMNQTAARLKMTSTHYVDSTGMPNPKHVTTPHDLALLARALINDYPQYYHYFSQKWLTYNSIKQPNRNRLLWRDPSVDGLKTGHTNAAGYCLVSSAKRDDMRLISVIMGTSSDSVRASESQALLNYGFRFYKTYALFDNQQVISRPRVWLGKAKHVDFAVEQPVYVTIPNGEYKNLEATINLSKQLRAPIVAGEAYGVLSINLGEKTIASAPLIAMQNDPKANIFSRLWDHALMFFKG